MISLKRRAAFALPLLATLAWFAAPAAQAQAVPSAALGFEQLPLRDAIVTVNGKGSRALAVFSDPNCPYCKRLERELAQLPDVRLYTFLIPVLGPDSELKSRRIWCAAQPQASWRRWMLDGVEPAEAACEAQFRNAFLMGCSGAWSLAPNQIAIAKRVFSPDVKEVLFAKRILAAMPDGSGVATIDGKMQDDATWKQAKVIVDLARLVARRDPQLAAAYEL